MLNYIGPNNGEGIKIYYDGQEVDSDTEKVVWHLPGEDGRIVVGRLQTYKDQNGSYASVQVDELIYFNAALTNDDVQSIYSSA